MVRGLVAPDIGGGMNPTERRVSFLLCFLVVIWESPLVPILQHPRVPLHFFLLLLFSLLNTDHTLRFALIVIRLQTKSER